MCVPHPGEVASEPADRLQVTHPAAEMNHPSAFFCKPSITSELSLQTATPTLQHTRNYTHARTQRRTHKTRMQHRSWRRRVLMTNQLKLREDAAPPCSVYLSMSTRLSRSSHSSLSSLAHITFTSAFFRHPAVCRPPCSPLL